jgi:N-glycosylase/DNA lyase
MRNLITRSVAGAGLLFCGLTANAQYPYQTPQSQYQRYRSDFRDVERVLSRAQNHLERATLNSWTDRDDRLRIQRAQQELSDIQLQLANGQYDQQELSQAIMALRRVVNNNQLPQGVRLRVENDLNQLREFRRDWR